MADYYTLLTTIGAARLANAHATRTPVNFAQIAVGDAEYDPAEGQAALVNEVWRGAINDMRVHADNPNWFVIETVIPEDVGGWFVREVGLFDDAGNLIAVGKYPSTYKPVLASGSARDILIRMILEVGNTADVNLSIDPSIVLATRNHVAMALAEHAADPDAHATATTERKGFVELATIAETRAMTDAMRAVTPAGLGAAIGDLKKTTLLERLLTAMADGSTGRALDAKPETYADTTGIDDALSSGITHDAAGAFIHNPGVAYVGTAEEAQTGTNAAYHWDYGGRDYIAIQVDSGSNTTITAARIVVDTINTAFNCHAEIWSDTGANMPSVSLAATAQAAGVAGLNELDLTAPLAVTADTKYWVIWFMDSDGDATMATVADTGGFITGSSSQTATGGAGPAVNFSDGSSLDAGEDYMLSAVFEAASQDMTVVSTALEAFAEPSIGYALALVEPIDAVEYGGDYLFDMALDDGTTWEAVAVEKIGTATVDVEGVETTVDVVYGEVAFATVGDQTIRSRQQAINSKHIKVHGLIVDAEV